MVKNNELRAELFLKEIAPLLSLYKCKWQKYFLLKGWEWDDDLFYDTVLKCRETISRLGLREGQQESLNYLFKALNMNYKRELQYARNKYREIVDDVEILGDLFESSLSDYKITKDLWLEFQFNYILKEVELNYDKNTFYIYKLKYVMQLSDDEIKKKTKNPNWKKDLRDVNKWLKNVIKKEDIEKDFGIKYPEIDLSILE